jgi:hypothetical protein
VNNNNIFQYSAISNADPRKAGPDKLKVFPLASYIAKMRKVLEEGTDAKRPEGDEPAKFASFKHDTLKNFYIVSSPPMIKSWIRRRCETDIVQSNDDGAVYRRDAEGGYQVPREKVHQVLVWAHHVTGHTGRDKMYPFIKKHYDPKRLVTQLYSLIHNSDTDFK